MSHSADVLSLDAFSLDAIEGWMATAGDMERGRSSSAGALSGLILCPVFAQESSRTYLNTVSSFARLGGTVVALTLGSTRFGSRWNEPVQDFATLVGACSDRVVLRSSLSEDLGAFVAHCDVPVINAGNGSGSGSEHPLQALVDLYTLRKQFGRAPLRILMIGGAHIRTTRTQIKLFLRLGHRVTILSPPSPVDNSDIERLYAAECERVDGLADLSLADYDLIYHNGIDEDPLRQSPDELVLDRARLVESGFNGKVMHSLPRKNELSSDVDASKFNLYFAQMANARYVFQSLFYHQAIGW